MRHLQNTKKFKRTEEERKRLWTDLATALITNGTITTFTARAKWFRPKFERLVTLVKRAGDDTQLAYTKVRPFLSEKIARKLIEEIVPPLKDRQGGYTIQIKVFQEFSPHDKSVVKIVSSDQSSQNSTEKPAQKISKEELQQEPKEKLEKKTKTPAKAKKVAIKKSPTKTTKTSKTK